MTVFDGSDYHECRLCPRQCGVDRRVRTGFCGSGSTCRIAYVGPHFGEEPPLSGQHGSGTLFFCGCPGGCFFCQNVQISRQGSGRIYSPDELYAAAAALAATPVHNLNFVTPEHWWPHLRHLCTCLRAAGMEKPFVWNSSGLFLRERLAEQAGLIDIFLPDFKFYSDDLAGRCLGFSGYRAVALEGLRLLVARLGFLRPFDRSGELTASRGVMVRHLVLPGQVADSCAVLRLLWREFGGDLPLALMRQFQPMPACHARGFLDRQVSEAEYDEVCGLAVELGFRRLFVQEKEIGSSFLPDFSHPVNPFAGNLGR